MRYPRRIIPDDRALLFMRGKGPFEFADRVTKLLADCLEQINEFFSVLGTIKDGQDGANGADGVDGQTPYIKNGYWYIGASNTGVPARGPQGPKGDTFTFNDLTPEQISALLVSLVTTYTVLRGEYKTVLLTTDEYVGETPELGTEIDVMYLNNTNADITITVDSTQYRTTTGEDLSILVPSGAYGEINYTNVDNVIYVRGA